MPENLVWCPPLCYTAAMRYYSTRNKNEGVTFAQAALAGLAPDGGLYVPETIPRYSPAIRSSLGAMSFHEIAFETIRPYVHPEISDPALEDIIQSAFSFPAPLLPVGGRFMLELFHGPTAAFKDFGARFMARTFSCLRRGESRPLRILVATSGDTGGAVADGFFGVEGISVTVLYPQGRISSLQEKQIAGLGGNVSALAVDGSFDDCQAMVKAAFADTEIKKRHILSSANSINIARLIPQAVYYAAAAGATPSPDSTFCVPSGNFGNLTAGLYAMNMGAPIRRFIAATNVNKTIPDYLDSGDYQTRLSQATISNAMDVGAPSNFERMAAHWSYDEMRRMILGVSVTDEDTRRAISRVYHDYTYFLDPHGAVGWQGAGILEERGLVSGPLAVLATAHPAKFADTVEPLTAAIPVPATLKNAMERTVRSRPISPDFSALRDFLNEN